MSLTGQARGPAVPLCSHCWGLFLRPVTLTEGRGSSGWSWGGTPAPTAEGKKAPDPHWGAGPAGNMWVNLRAAGRRVVCVDPCSLGMGDSSSKAAGQGHLESFPCGFVHTSDYYLPSCAGCWGCCHEKTTVQSWSSWGPRLYRGTSNPARLDERNFPEEVTVV